MIIRQHTFRLGLGVGEEEFLAADRRVQAEVVPFAPGFIRRTTARADDGTWMVQTLWGDHDCAQDAAEQRHDAVAILRACVDPSTETVTVFETLD